MKDRAVIGLVMIVAPLVVYLVCQDMTKRLARRQFVHIAVNQWIDQIVHELTLLGCHYVRQITCSDACFVEHNVERQHFLRLLPEPEAVLCELLAVGVTTNRITAKHRGQRTQPINEARVLIHCLGVINVKVQMDVLRFDEELHEGLPFRNPISKVE